MTMVHIRLRAPTNGGTRAGVGMVVFQPSARHTDDASVVLPDTFTVVLDEEGEATVDIQPTGPDWCWKTDAQGPAGPAGPGIVFTQGAPTGSGVAGAMYVDKTTFDVYVWRAD